MTPARARVLGEIADSIASAHAQRIAIDGRSAAGKSTLGDEARGMRVARMTGDDFHRPEEERYARGRDSAEGFYRDSFLFIPALVDVWDLRIWLEIDERTSLERGPPREVEWMGSIDAARRRYEVRYVPGERKYIEEVDPQALADIVVVNDDPASPRFDRKPT